MDDFEKAKEEQARKRELYRQQQKARIGSSLPKKPSAKGLKQGIGQAKQAKEMVQIAAGAAGGPVGVTAAVGKVEGKKIAKAVAKGGVKSLTKVASQQGSQAVLDALWNSIVQPLFILNLIALNIYALASSGILNAIWPGVSKKLAPFGYQTKMLPFGLGQILGIIVLITLDILTFVIIVIIIALLYYATHPTKGFMDIFVG